MNRCTVITDIKNQISQCKQKEYQLVHESNTNKHYSLYLPQIITIQRQFRNYLCRKTNLLEERLIRAIDFNQQLKEQAEQIQFQKLRAYEQKQNAKNFNIDQEVRFKKQKLQKDVRKSTASLLLSGEKLAKNKGLVKLAINHNKKIRTEIGLVSEQLHSLQFQQECYHQKRNDWKRKKTQLRSKIIEESTKKLQLQRQYQKMLQGYLSQQKYNSRV